MSRDASTLDRSDSQAAVLQGERPPRGAGAHSYALGDDMQDASYICPSHCVSSTSSAGAAALLQEAVAEYMLNTSRLAKRQRRRLSGLQDKGDWRLHRLDATPVLGAMYCRNAGTDP